MSGATSAGTAGVPCLVGELSVFGVLGALAAERPVFHSEADFQHHLAWMVRQLDPAVGIRLETRPLPGQRLELDLLLAHRSSGQRVAVELKYATRSLSVEVDGERFVLRDHAAQDVIRHDFAKDLYRLERLVAAGVVDHGWAVLLTNDRGYWTESARTTVDSAFRLHEGRSLGGTLGWSDAASAGTRARRNVPLPLEGRYLLSWADFSRLDETSSGGFRFLAVPVGGARKVNPASGSPGIRRLAGKVAPADVRVPVSPAGQAGSDRDFQRLQQMIDELRTMRGACEPKANSNPRYLRYSNAVSALKWITGDLRAESE